MKLTIEEFKKIRTVQWKSGLTSDGTMYYTPIDPVSTVLFNLDLLRLVIAPKFQKQNAITHISNFDTLQPVILLSDLELRVSPELETAMYFATESRADDREKSNRLLRVSSWRSSFSMLLITVLYIIILLLMYCCANGHVSTNLTNLLHQRLI